MELIEEYSEELARQRLNEIYAQIPQAACDRCVRCCTNVVIVSVEFENILRYIENNFTAEFKRILQAKFSLNIATQVRQTQIMQKENIEKMLPWEVCAFLDEKEKKCLIYLKRPFACRIFGLEDESRCFTKSIRFKHGLKISFDSGKIDILEGRLDSISGYYRLSPDKQTFTFNKAEINSWFYYQDKILPVNKGRHYKK